MDELDYEALIDLAQHPHHHGVMEQPDLTLKGTNASCGDQVTIFIQFEKPDDPTSPIKAIQWVGEGCVISRASTSVLAEKIHCYHWSLSDIAALKAADVEEMLGMSHISPGRLKCLLLGVKTLAAKSYA